MRGEEYLPGVQMFSLEEMHRRESPGKSRDRLQIAMLRKRVMAMAQRISACICPTRTHLVCGLTESPSESPTITMPDFTPTRFRRGLTNSRRTSRSATTMGPPAYGQTTRPSGWPAGRRNISTHTPFRAERATARRTHPLTAATYPGAAYGPTGLLHSASTNSTSSDIALIAG